MSSETSQPHTENRRNQVMVGDLPNDFLRAGTPSQQQQSMADQRVAHVLQAQQQAGFGAIPANVKGKLSISVVQAKLTKNYGLTKMDPYCRVRVGHSVFETPTAYNGAKNPHWGKEVHCYLPHGVDNMYVEIFDERSFTVDDRVAWAYVVIPPASLNGETVDEWFPLSGKQGDEKEGVLNLILTFTPVENLPPAFQPSVFMPQPMVQPMVYTYPQPVYPAMQVPQQQQQQQQVPQGPPYSEDDFNQVKEMFPNMEDEVIKSVFAANSGNKDSTINSLLQMSAD